MQHSSPRAGPHQVVFHPYWSAPDSIGRVTDSVPAHPEDKHPSFDDSKHKKPHKPHPVQLSEESEVKHPDADSDHWIDEYA
jgi:hypothetical protein